MRLFIAVTLNEEIRDYLSKAIQKLKMSASRGNFTDRGNLHLTLVFLGEIGEERLGAVKSAMNRIEEASFPLSFEGFGTFGRRNGDIYWAGVAWNKTLITLQKKLSAELKHEGFSLEEREYSPHLTLGREIRTSDTAKVIYGSLTEEKHRMTVSKISLMKSERIDGKLVYTEIYEKGLS